jgi:hypothetical protein
MNHWRLHSLAWVPQVGHPMEGWVTKIVLAHQVGRPWAEHQTHMPRTMAVHRPGMLPRAHQILMRIAARHQLGMHPPARPIHMQMVAVHLHGTHPLLHLRTTPGAVPLPLEPLGEVRLLGLTMAGVIRKTTQAGERHGYVEFCHI